MIFDVLLEDVEGNTTCGSDKVSRVPQGVFVVAPTLSTVAFEKELGGDVLESAHHGRLRDREAVGGHSMSQWMGWLSPLTSIRGYW